MIGIAAIPFVAFGLLCVGLFGKAVMLAWIGRRCLGRRAARRLSHPAVGGAHRRPHRAGAVRRSGARLLGLQGARTLGPRRRRLYAHRQCTRAGATRAAREASRARPSRRVRRRGRTSRGCRAARRSAGPRPQPPPRRHPAARAAPADAAAGAAAPPARRARRHRSSRPPCRGRGFGSACWRCSSTRCSWDS